MSLLINYIDGIEAVGNILYKYLGKRFKSLKVGPLELQLRGETEKTHEATLAKLQNAHTSLAEAVEAIDVIRFECATESDRLAKLVEDINTKRAEAKATNDELSYLQKLTDEERNLLKTSLGVNDKRSKIAGFISGVLASVLATALWVGVPKAIEFGKAHFGTPPATESQQPTPEDKKDG